MSQQRFPGEMTRAPIPWLRLTLHCSLSPEEISDRNRRLKRAMDLGVKHSEVGSVNLNWWARDRHCPVFYNFL